MDSIKNLVKMPAITRFGLSWPLPVVVMGVLGVLDFLVWWLTGGCLVFTLWRRFGVGVGVFGVGQGPPYGFFGAK